MYDRGQPTAMWHAASACWLVRRRLVLPPARRRRIPEGGSIGKDQVPRRAPGSVNRTRNAGSPEEVGYFVPSHPEHPCPCVCYRFQQPVAFDEFIEDILKRHST